MNKVNRIDFKLLGTIKYIPFLIDICLYLTCKFLLPYNKDSWLALELLIPYSVIWLGTFYIAEMIQNNSIIEVLYAWNRGLLRVLTIKYIVFSLIGVLIGLITASIICAPMDFESAKYFLLLLFFECVAFSGIGFFLSVCIRNAGWVITIIMCVIVSDYGTQGKLFGKLHLFMYWYDELSMELITGRIIAAMLISFCSFLVGYKILKETKGMGLLSVFSRRKC